MKCLRNKKVKVSNNLLMFKILTTLRSKCLIKTTIVIAVQTPLTGSNNSSTNQRFNKFRIQSYNQIRERLRKKVSQQPNKPRMPYFSSSSNWQQLITIFLLGSCLGIPCLWEACLTWSTLSSQLCIPMT